MEITELGARIKRIRKGKGTRSSPSKLRRAF